MTHRLCISSVVVMLFAGIEFLGAYLSHSTSLLYDGMHMLVDTWALGFAAFVSLIAGRKNLDQERQKTESRGAFVSMSLLAMVGVVIIIYAVYRVYHPPLVQPEIMLGVAIMGLIVNLGILLFLRKEHKESHNTDAAYFHVYADTITSVGVIVAAMLIFGTDKNVIDPLMSVGIGAVILGGALYRMHKSSRHLQELKEQEA